MQKFSDDSCLNFCWCFGRSDYTKIMKSFFLVLSVILSNAAFSADPIKVAVGMYPFAPFVEHKGSSGNVGMTIDLIAALNKIQKQYQFESILIPPKRRYQSYKDGHYDVIFYETRTWGWHDIDIEVSRIYQTGGEVYVALKQPGRGQEYFEKFDDKKMMGILGFHYGFADFNANEEYLIKNYRMLLSKDNDKNLSMLLKGRGDVVVVTKAYLHRYFLNYPDAQDQLLISDKLDQEYNHTVLVRPGIKPSVVEINHMLEILEESGALRELLKKYGISQD